MANETISFTKMHGCGNDFIMIDGRQGLGADGELDANKLTAALCDRRRGVGGDGLIVLLPSRSDADFTMLYINSTGVPGEMCGNGARCAAQFAYDIGAAPAEMRFDTDAGLVKALIGEDDVTIDMPPPRDIQLGVMLEIDGQQMEVHYALVGVPHAVVLVDDLENYPVDRIGALLRHHPIFPRGANANFVSTSGDLAMRTFERGVEAETLACGTGSVAVSTICYLLGVSELDTRVRTGGGDWLAIRLEREGEAFTRATLTGPTETVGKGAVERSFLASRDLVG